MKESVKNHFEVPASRPVGAMTDCQAFTLIELFVVVGVIAMLVTLLIPAMAGAKGDNGRAECQNNLKQLGIGFHLFEQDHNEMFPPAGFEGAPPAFQISWDSYIHRYIGGTVDDALLAEGVVDITASLKVLVCPADPQRTVNWNVSQGQWFYGKRSYAMVGTFQYWEVSPFETYAPYLLANGTQLGVGVFWQDQSVPASWDAKSFKTSIVKDPAGTLLLVEQGENCNIAGNILPCCSLGVDMVGWGGNLFCQMNSQQQMVPDGFFNANLGKFLYQNHGFRYNYLFHDGHVETLATNATIGTGTPSAPKGMWTVTVGD